MMKYKSIMDFEMGELSSEDAMKLFNSLLITGEIWRLPTQYLNIAAELLEHGFIHTTKPKRTH